MSEFSYAGINRVLLDCMKTTVEMTETDVDMSNPLTAATQRIKELTQQVDDIRKVVLADREFFHGELEKLEAAFKRNR